LKACAILVISLSNERVKMNLQTYADKVIVEHEHTQVNVYLENIDLCDVLAQFSTEEVLKSLVANDNYSDIVDFVNRSDDE
jgi:hypothetical protein